MQVNKAVHPSVFVKKMIKDFNVKMFKNNIGISSAIYSFIRMKTCITPNIAKKLTIIFPNTDVEFWLKMQENYECSKLKEQEC